MSEATATADAQAVEGGTVSPPSESGLAGYTTLFAWMIKKRIILLVRYPVNTLAQFMSSYLFFIPIFFGGKLAASQVGGISALGSTFDGLIVGWFVWTMAMHGYFSQVMTASEEAQWGTLEQLYMSAYGFSTVMIFQAVTFILEAFTWGVGILVLMLATTGRTLTVDVLTVVPITAFVLLCVAGISFTFGGLALVYKRIQNVNSLVQILLIGLVAAPVSGFQPLRYLPMVQGSDMLQRAMQDGVRLWEFPTGDLVLLVGAGIGYFLLGFAVFRYATTVARRRGIMGHY